jgi:hypothetical protein
LTQVMTNGILQALAIISRHIRGSQPRLEVERASVQNTRCLQRVRISAILACGIGPFRTPGGARRAPSRLDSFA